MKARVNWLLEGERNMRYFHTSTRINRKRNKIVALKNNRGEWIHEQGQLQALIQEYFGNLYKIEKDYGM